MASLWFPDWPLIVHARAHGALPDDKPFALVERGAHGVVLTAINPAARALGLRRGQRHADASAMVPGLLTEPARPNADAQALAALAHWCIRWSPSVAVDAPDGIFIDCGGSAHLFGGAEGLAAGIVRRLATAGIDVRVAIAPTPGAAWAAARFGRSKMVLDENLSAAAAAWPLAALRLEPATLSAASALGLRAIGDLYAMPRAGLARRFRGDLGLGLVERLDQLLGTAGEALDMMEEPASHAVRAVFAEPVTEIAGVAARLPAMLDDLAAQLTRSGLGAIGLRLTGCRVDGCVTSMGLRMGASRDVKLWQRLIDTTGLEHLDLGFGIDALVLAASATGVVAEADRDLQEEETTRESLPQLIDRLSARLQRGAVRVARGEASWLPERAERWRPAQGNRLDDSGPADPTAILRPLIILDPPEIIEATALVPHGAPIQFRWRRLVRRVARVEGPERIAPEWWRGPVSARTRDYYRVEDTEGQRFWLFREGLYDSGDTVDATPPAWWLHGVFA